MVATAAVTATAVVEIAAIQRFTWTFLPRCGVSIDADAAS
jgi:hypothetical protein